MVISLRTMKRAAALLLIAVLIPSLLFPPAYAASNGGDAADNGGDAPAETAGADGDAAAPAPGEVNAASRTAARAARPPRISLADAAATAEKMYYSGELYLFADSMIKTNYETATIAATVKTSVQSGALLKSRSTLNSLEKNYNAISEKYNTWVDVKGDLEYFIEKIGPRNAITKSQLQTVYSRTVKTLNETKALLEKAREYYDEKSTESKRALTGAANNLTSSAAKSVNTISPVAQKALSGYRALFDQFATQAGLEIEYKTWINPEAAITGY